MTLYQFYSVHNALHIVTSFIVKSLFVKVLDEVILISNQLFDNFRPILKGHLQLHAYGGESDSLQRVVDLCYVYRFTEHLNYAIEWSFFRVHSMSFLTALNLNLKCCMSSLPVDN